MAKHVSTEMQILALKRKIIECDRELKTTQEREMVLEQALDMEKREHQLTTSKLTQLLKKRGASAADLSSSGQGAEVEVNRLRQTVLTLQRNQLQSEEREAGLRQRLAQACAQCELYRAGMSAGLSAESISRLNVAVPTPVTGPSFSGSSEPLPTHAEPRVYQRKAAELGVGSKRATPSGTASVAASDAAPEDVSPELSQSSSSPSPVSSTDAPLGPLAGEPAADASPADAAPAVFTAAAACSDAAAAPAAATAPASVAASTPATPANPPPTPVNPAAAMAPAAVFAAPWAARAGGGGVRVPFGYVPGAISIEMPKRQRTQKHNPAFPRSYSSLV